MNILVTGGAGYIGSHAALHLLDAGHSVTILDNLFRGHRAAVATLESLAPGRVHFEEADLAEGERIESILRAQSIDTVMHFAALIEVGEE